MVLTPPPNDWSPIRSHTANHSLDVGAIFSESAGILWVVPMKPLTNRSAATAFFVVAVLSILPFAFVAIPPLVDYPNHLARCSVLASLSQSPALQSMYEQREVILPNLAMDAIVVPLAHLMPVIAAGKLFCALIHLLTLSGGIALSYALMRKITAWSFAPALFLFNHIYTFGFLNYLFGVAVLMWALAAWIAVRERRRSARIAVGVFFALALFLSHIVAMGLFACALAGFELSRCVEPRGIRAKALSVSVAEVAALFVVPAILLLGSPTHTEAAEIHVSSFMAKVGAIGDLLRVAPGRMDVLYSTFWCWLWRSFWWVRGRFGSSAERCTWLPPSSARSLCCLSRS